jgi:quercetin dioxygenase-like cupin family protein
MEPEKFQHSKIFSFAASVDYAPRAVVSKTLVKKTTGTITLFAFDQGQSLSEHTAPFDALIQMLDGEAEIIINKKSYMIASGSSIILPANNPHAVNAVTRFKMLLTMIKE